LQMVYGGVGAAAMWVPTGSALAFGADGGAGTTELMRLTNTGLVIGASSSSQKLEVSGGAAQFNGGGIDASLGDAILFGNSSFPTVQKNRIRSSISAGNSGNNLLVFEASTSTAGTYSTNQLVLAGTGRIGFQNDAMTLDASGRLIVGATSVPDNGLTAYFANNVPVGVGIYLSASVGYIGTWTNHPFAFAVNQVEKARIDTSGNLLVGTTSTSGNAGIQFLPNAGGTGIGLQSINHVTGSASGNYYHSFNYAGGGIGSITQAGTTGVLYNVTSD